jgi:hypothetical protein
MSIETENPYAQWHLGDYGTAHARNPIEQSVGPSRIVRGNPYENWMQRQDTSPGFYQPPTEVLGGLDGVCWHDPVSGQKSCEPLVWTPGAIEAFLRTTSDNFRSIHAQVQACRKNKGISDATRQEWSQLYNRWIAWVKSGPSMYWSATPNTILGYVKELNSWSQLLKAKGAACSPRAALKATKDAPKSSILDPLLGGEGGTTLKWAVGGAVALAAVYAIKTLRG